MDKKVFTDESLSTFVSEIKAYTDRKIDDIGVEAHIDSKGTLYFSAGENYNEDGTQTGSITIDKTLSVSGAAADAKATGDAINKLYDEIGYYYPFLSTAIADINNGTTANALIDRSAAKVRISKAENGRTTVTLLDDLTDSAQIDIDKDIDLVLNGSVLTFTVSGAHLNFKTGTDCKINGEVVGSMIEHIGGSGESVALRARGKLSIKGGRYSAKNAGLACITLATYAGSETILEDAEFIAEFGASYTRCLQFLGGHIMKRCSVSSRGESITEGCALYDSDVYIEDSNVAAVCTSNINNVYGIRNIANSTSSNITALRTTIHTDSPDFNTGSIGFYMRGVAKLYDCEIYGMHSAVRIEPGSKYYVNGGTYTGYCHGGFYCCQGSEGEAYINDAKIRNGNYKGEFDVADKESFLYGGTYIGGGNLDNYSNMAVYFDNCTFEPESNYSIVLRGTDGETNNTLNISNSIITNSIRVDAGKGHKVNIGIGGNITADKIAAGADVTMTGKLYRKNSPDKALDGKDFSAIMAVSDIHAGSDFTVQSPEYAASTEKMIDKNKIYLGSNGNIWAYITQAIVERKNQYNPNTAKFNYRWSFSSDVLAITNGSVLIEINGIDLVGKSEYIINIEGVEIVNNSVMSGTSGQLILFDSDGAVVGENFMLLENGNCPIHKKDNGYYIDIMKAAYHSDTAVKCYLILGIKDNTSIGSVDCANLFIEVVPFSTVTEQKAWGDTGIKYANYIMSDADAELVADKVLERLDVSFVSVDNTLAVGQYTLRYENTSETVADIGVAE